MKKKKILIFIPAYNVEKTVTKVIKKIPKIIYKKFHIGILVIEDYSKDNTIKVL